jgi:ABC-type tungstate transport system substrate-binding protein
MQMKIRIALTGIMLGLALGLTVAQFLRKWEFRSLSRIEMIGVYSVGPALIGLVILLNAKQK